MISTLTKGDTVTVGQVFHTMLIKSANDCAVILAEYVAGSESKFIDMMNAEGQGIRSDAYPFRQSERTSR